VTDLDPQPGDWVQIRAKVVARPTPENVTIELFSRVDQYTTDVRVSACEVIPKPIPDEPGVNSVVLVESIAYQHLAGRWYEPGWGEASDGHTWASLHELGDVEVIHRT
jgi:hypothetical protein